MSELKPCPNPKCRSMRITGVRRRGASQVLCVACGCAGPLSSGEKKAMQLWNALPRAPQWTTYDGTEETLPDKGTLGALLLSRKEPKTGLRVKDVVWRVSAGWLNDRCQEYPYSVGDRWRYWPKEDDNDY